MFPLDRLLRQCDQDREERHIRTYTLYFYFLNIFYFYFFSTSFFFFLSLPDATVPGLGFHLRVLQKGSMLIMLP